MRFQHTRWTRERLDIPVDFPIKDLDLNKYVLDKSTNNIYDLNGVTIHMGGPDGGHYIAYGRGSNGKWYCFNDSLVSNSTEEEVSRQDVGSYVLFYIKRGSQEDIQNFGTYPTAEEREAKAAADKEIADREKAEKERVEAEEKAKKEAEEAAKNPQNEGENNNENGNTESNNENVEMGVATNSDEDPNGVQPMSSVEAMEVVD